MENDGKGFVWAVKNRAGLLAWQNGDYAAAEEHFRSALAWAEQEFQATDPRMIPSLNNLAQICLKLNKPNEATSLSQRALALLEQHLGSNHPDVALATESFARLLKTAQQASQPSTDERLSILRTWDEHYRNAVEAQAEGRYAEAEELFQEALSLAEQLPKGDLRLADTLFGKGSALSLQSKFHDAKPLLRRALDIRLNSAQPTHPKTADVLCALAMIYLWQCKYPKAESLLWQALEIRLQVVSADHPDVGQDLHGLAALYHAQRNFSEAEPLYRRSIAILQKAYGTEHKLVKSAISNLARMTQAIEPISDLSGSATAIERFTEMLTELQVDTGMQLSCQSL